MEWREFGIEEVARLCGIQMKNDGMGAREIKALCPFCSDKHYHLYLNTREKSMELFSLPVQKAMMSVCMQR